VDSRNLKTILKDEDFLGEVVFVLGTGRNGSTLLRSLLDGNHELIVWPFEFPFYTIFYDKWGKCSTEDEFQISEMLATYDDALLQFKKNYTGDLGSHEYKLKGFDVDAFFNTLDAFKDEYCTRPEFLKLLAWSFYVSNSKSIIKPKGFVVVHNQPSTAILEDFDICKIVALVRDPLETYISNKEYYFRAAKNTGRDKSCVYRPFAANKRFRSLIETSISPIVFTYNWFGKNTKIKYFYVMHLDELRENPEVTMKELSEFLGIKFNEELIKATFFGEVHHSNLSSGEAANGKILAKARKTKNDLSKYECNWINKILKEVYQNAPMILDRYGNKHSYEIKVSLLSFLTPMMNEFPNHGGDKRGNRTLLNHVILRGGRYFFAIIAYFVNRYIFIMSSYKRILKSWPMAR